MAVASTLEEMTEELRRDHPQLAWRREQVVDALQRVGLGGTRIMDRMIASGVLRRIEFPRPANGAPPVVKHDRFDREHVLRVIREAMGGA